MAFKYRPINRRRFLLGTTVAIGAVYTAAATYPFLASLMPSESAKAAGGPVEVDISKLVAGQMHIVAWRGQPVWILRRTPEMLVGLPKHDELLADPESSKSSQPDSCRNPDRSSRPNVFVCVGVCTHLGCSPTMRVDPAATVDLGKTWPGGFFCPCHGSKFDLAGRVFKDVPASTNLVIPPYRYVSDERLMIGDEEKA